MPFRTALGLFLSCIVAFIANSSSMPSRIRPNTWTYRNADENHAASNILKYICVPKSVAHSFNTGLRVFPYIQCCIGAPLSVGADGGGGLKSCREKECWQQEASLPSDLPTGTPVARRPTMWGLGSLR